MEKLFFDFKKHTIVDHLQFELIDCTLKVNIGPCQKGDKIPIVYISYIDDPYGSSLDYNNHETLDGGRMEFLDHDRKVTHTFDLNLNIAFKG